MMISVIGVVVLVAFCGLCLVVLGTALAASLNLLLGLLGHPWAPSREPPDHNVRPRIPEEIRSKVLKRDHYQCQWCGSQHNLQLDHVIPISKGGATNLENLQVLCGSCNEKKGASP